MAKRGEVVFKNGATATRLPNGMLRIVTGPTKGSKRRTVSKRSAKRAFNKYWNKRSSAVKDNKKRSRGVASARGRDILYGNPNNLRKHSGYKQNPGRLDYAGVDYGSRRYKVSPKSLANLRGGAAKKTRAKRGRPSNAMKYTGHASRLGRKGSACSGLVEKDCNKHPACDYRSPKGKSAHCARKNTGKRAVRAKKASPSAQAMRAANRANGGGLWW